MSEKLTDWFEPSVNPTVKGWYEREYAVDFLQKQCDWWDGEAWFSGLRGKAEQCATLPRRWRGLAEKPGK